MQLMNEFSFINFRNVVGDCQEFELWECMASNLHTGSVGPDAAFDFQACGSGGLLANELRKAKSPGRYDRKSVGNKQTSATFLRAALTKDFRYATCSVARAVSGGR